MRVLINGGGIGGFALAHFLAGAGLTPIVLERAPAFSALGHVIALKADGVAVLDRLGIRAECTQRALPSTLLLHFATSAGRVLREEPVARFDAALGGYLAMRRADLHAALYGLVKDRVDIRFGRQVRAFQADADGVAVTLSDGTSERAAALIGADGVHSAVRHMLFGDAGERLLGGSYVAIEVSCPHGAPVGKLQVFFGRGRQVAVIPVSAGRLLGIVYHAGEPLRPLLKTPLLARLFFAREYADFAPLVRMMFAAIDEHGFVFSDDIKMITLPALHVGRVALLGDAGACPTFMSGMGSAFAMLSAEQLAARLAKAQPEHVPAALAAYSDEALAMARALQSNALSAAKLILGRSWALTAVRNAVIQFTPEALVLRRTRRFYRAGSEAAAQAAHAG